LQKHTIRQNAIIDTLYYRGVIPAQDEPELDGINFNLLSKMAALYPPHISRTISDILKSSKPENY